MIKEFDDKRRKAALDKKEFTALKEQGLFIKLRTIDSSPGAWMVVDGQKVLNLCTNNNLGLAGHPASSSRKLRMRQPVTARDRRQCGPLRGQFSIHVALEKAIADFKNVEDTLYVQGGFMADHPGNSRNVSSQLCIAFPYASIPVHPSAPQITPHIAICNISISLCSFRPLYPWILYFCKIIGYYPFPRLYFPFLPASCAPLFCLHTIVLGSSFLMRLPCTTTVALISA